MRTLPAWAALALALALVCGAAFLCGCRGQAEGLAGEYAAESGQGTEARLILRPDGGGALSVGAEEAVFRWELRSDGRLFLHTRQGGILSARYGPDRVEVDLPGVGRLQFRKSAPRP